MKSVVVALAAFSILAGCEVAVGLTVGATGVGLAVGHATERIASEQGRIQPVAITDTKGRVLARPDETNPRLVARFQVSDSWLECRSKNHLPLRMNVPNVVKAVLNCDSGLKASTVIELRPDSSGPSTFKVNIDAVAEDRAIACGGSFRHQANLIDPFGVECVEAYRAPCETKQDPTARKLCRGDLSTALKVQFSPRRSSGVVSMSNEPQTGTDIRLWISPLE